MEMKHSYFTAILLFIAFDISSALSLTSVEEEGEKACNITTLYNLGRGRYKRNSPKHGQDLMVCITANSDNVNVHGSSSKRKHHSQQDEESDSNSSEQTTRKPDDDDSSSETEEDDLTSSNHNGNSNRPTHNSGGSKLPSKSKYGKRKGKENIRVILEEQFTYRNWSSEWVPAKNANGSTTKLYNKFSRVYARKSNHSRPNYGIITNNKGGEFYMIATTFPPFNNRNETLVLQFSVQFQSKAHCQLAFLRLYDCQFSTDEFGIQTPYIMQVGPYICATTGINRLTTEFQEPRKTTIRSVDKDIEPVNNTSVNTYTLALEPDGTFHLIINTNSTQNGTLKDHFQNYKGYTSICAAGLAVWHSVLDKYFKGQIIVDDVLVVNNLRYAEKKRKQILNLYSE